MYIIISYQYFMYLNSWKTFLLIFNGWVLQILTLKNYREHVDYNRSQV